MMIVQVEEKHSAGAVSNSFEKLAQSWLAFNSDKKVATVVTYAKALKSFFTWLADNKITKPTRGEVLDYKASLCSTKKVSTARLYLAAVKVFSKWLAANDLYVDFAAGVKNPKLDEESEQHSRDALTIDEVKAVLNSFEGSDEKTMRDKLIMRLMINCGLRSVEIIRLDSTDVERRSGKTYLRIWGKGRDAKTARVQISKSIEKMIVEYLNKRGAKFKVGEPMFTSTANRNRGQRLQTQSISKLAKKTFRAVGIDCFAVTCHSCRHTTAQLLLDNGVALEKIQKLLRHKNSETTKVYLRDREAKNDDTVQRLSDWLDAVA